MPVLDGKEGHSMTAEGIFRIDRFEELRAAFFSRFESKARDIVVSYEDGKLYFSLSINGVYVGLPPLAVRRPGLRGVELDHLFAMAADAFNREISKAEARR
ncbi:hypothetical protein LB565_04310 [Mesorhizobium sp. CA14]|uniref:hypothetical protein n=1 Tax=Mesorhizobium sp. CA14 TaxID=2876642 RepID=UPI001CCC92B4|nr:hypothetical protein [Mesorhizobium sp. CA14]MBZ9847211.1 hypothetical protein [Mesorhizobium sp. CA14]